MYIVSFDRAGYGESDPNPKRSVRSEAFDIQELADQLKLGPRFYIIGMSLGTYPVWACLKYIPHRQATLSHFYFHGKFGLFSRPFVFVLEPISDQNFMELLY